MKSKVKMIKRKINGEEFGFNVAPITKLVTDEMKKYIKYIVGTYDPQDITPELCELYQYVHKYGVRLGLYE